ncbi:hypothetical protein D3C86_1430040 [compost metagenome]
MFPDIAAEKRLLPEAQRIDPVFGAGDLQRTIGVHHQPRPARAELGSAGEREILFEQRDRAEGLCQRVFQHLRYRVVFRPHDFPEEIVVPVLRSIVEDAGLRHRALLIGAPDDLFEAPLFPFGA